MRRVVWQCWRALLGAAALLPAGLSAQSGLRTRHVILMTIDGVRGQEFFRGMDSVIAASGDSSGIYDLARLKRDFWRSSPGERRRVLMPFFWDSLAPRGIVYGNRALGSAASITNGQGFSAPGYQEILTGQAQADVTSNDPVRYRHLTVLEYVRRRLRLAESQVAAITSWENFRYYVASDSAAVFVNAGYVPIPPTLATPRLRYLERLQQRGLALWEGSRLDVFTGAIALEYLKSRKPTLLYISFNDTDDLAHSRRYDRLLDAFHATDDFLRELWQAIQATPELKGRTTLILTTDHGRGFRSSDWDDHGKEVPGSEQIWAAVIGPDTPAAGEARNLPEVHQADIAATILELLGLAPADFNPAAGPPLPGAVRH
ncbi:MAG TPA: alkaline phosphatase family protein [Gemmatimonadales bacterium]|nr:alkaline phosphatase family protein [Gemmatimonadales bacterium]